MRVDIGNALADTAIPGVPRSALERLDDRVATAHKQIEQGMEDGRYGYAALTLPERVNLQAIQQTVEPVVDAGTLLVVGIGGSALGAATIAGALGDGSTEVKVLDNVDPTYTRALLDTLDLSDTALHIVSRSGTTAETMANMLVVRAAFREADIDWSERSVVTTGSEGPLRELAKREDMTILEAPAGVPGRFAALSTVGLPAAIAAGVDVNGLLAGAKAERATLSGSLFDCPAYAYGATAFALLERGATVNAVMPYAEALEPFAEWLAQLWAESLGKDGLGQTPARALGATDQHSQLQLYRAGPRTTMVSLIRPQDREDLDIPSPDAPALEYLEGSSLGELLDAEFRATEASLARAKRPSVRVEVPRLDANGLGRLLYGFEAATVLVGELTDVPTFTQPAVEWGKTAAREILQGDSSSVSDTGGEFVIE